jgi:cysteinyl-tRNA synthetase
MLKLFNSYTRQIEEFKPLNGKDVAMYSCGPTVYDYVHIGNLRSFLFADVLRRVLEHDGYKVKQVMNLTDVGHMLHDADAGEDKVETAAAKAGTTPQEITQKYSQYFFDVIKKLNIEPAAEYPKASDNVPQMIAIVKTLIEKGFAYQVGGDVYFDVRKFEKYGQLSGNTLANLEAGARVEVNDKKRDPLDFALWISNDQHVMNWPSPWSTKGYPGWHIECSAMAMRYLGETLDIHTGGEDNKFPHHECEIAQSESATGKQFAKYWIHSSFLLVDGQKMSKSLNNFYKVEDPEAKGYSPRVVRYSLISSHYREQQNFTFDSLSAAKSALAKIDNLAVRLAEGDGNGASPRFNMEKGAGPVSVVAKDAPVEQIIEVAERDFYDAMDDDINVPRALGSLFVFVRELNAALDAGVDPTLKKAALRALKMMVSDTLGLAIEKVEVVAVDDELKKLLVEREAARAAKDFARADAIRKTLSDRGYAIEDAAGGARLKKI